MVDLEESIVGYDATIGWDDGTLGIKGSVLVGAMRPIGWLMGPTHLFNLKDISWDDIWGLDFEETTIAKDNCLERKSLLQFVDDGTGLVFLKETDASVEEKKGADNAKIDPILETGSKDGGRLMGTKY